MSKSLPKEFHGLFRPVVTERQKDGPKRGAGKPPQIARYLEKCSADVVPKTPDSKPVLELQPNPSPFAVYVAIRGCLQERRSRCEKPAQKPDQERDSDERKVIPLPKLVLMGLNGMLDLIKGSCRTHPDLCIRVLRSLLDTLQGLAPEAMKDEPKETIDKLFSLLLELSSLTDTTDPLLTLSSLSSSCLVSLAIATGETAKTLATANCLLLPPNSQLTLPTPLILIALQRAIHSLLCASQKLPRWLDQGVPANPVLRYRVKFPQESNSRKEGCCLASDGSFLYLLKGGVLYKITTGFGDSQEGQVTVMSRQLSQENVVWIGVCAGYLLAVTIKDEKSVALKLDKDTLQVVKKFVLQKQVQLPNTLFSDGQALCCIVPHDDLFTVKTIYRPCPEMEDRTTETVLKLTKKSLLVFGQGVISETHRTEKSDDKKPIVLSVNSGEEPEMVTCGKDFGLAIGSSGNVYATGRVIGLGVKQGNSRWSDMKLSAKRIAVGHDGSHAVFITPEGSVYFAGTARRGEDGEPVKGKGQPRTIKPRRIAKMEGVEAVDIACNNGTTAIVSNTGDLYLFGKDALGHAEPNSGLVNTGVKEVTQVCLGKAHGVAVTSNGSVYTFGVNHKGQCARELASSAALVSADLSENSITTASSADSLVDPSSELAAAAVVVTDKETSKDKASADGQACPPHQFASQDCKICRTCLQCTGYGSQCIASMGLPADSQRLPGDLCGCGVGDAGCVRCGSCRVCANRVGAEAPSQPKAAPSIAPVVPISCEQNQRLAAAMNAQVAGGDGFVVIRKMPERMRRREEFSPSYSIARSRDRDRDDGSRRFQRKSGKGRDGPLHRFQQIGDPVIINNLRCASGVGSSREDLSSSSDAAHQLADVDCGKLASLPAVKLNLAHKVLQAATGVHHTVLLLETGNVLTFGNNQHGQLGHGRQSSASFVQGLPGQSKVVQVAAGSNHTVMLLNNGAVYTCGSFQKGQLCRTEEDFVTSADASWNSMAGPVPWNAVAGPVPGIGAPNAKKATWIGASGDHTFLRIDESLIDSRCLSSAIVTATRQVISIIPDPSTSDYSTLMMNRQNGVCKGHPGPHLLSEEDCVTFDHVYDLLWSYNRKSQMISIYHTKSDLPLAATVPSLSEFPITRQHAALSLIHFLDLAAKNPREHSDDRASDPQALHRSRRSFAKDDFSIVNRFDSHGGGWGYSGCSIEAIRFMADTDVLLGGLGLFGGRGEYLARLRIYDLGDDGGDNEPEGEILIDMDDRTYECPARHKYSMMFDDPVPIQANRWYLAWARISGPSSDCGSLGQHVVVTEDQVTFSFKSSKRSNNGTDANAGQIPQLLYRLMSPESGSNRALGLSEDGNEPAYTLSKDFATGINSACFHWLLTHLKWIWKELQQGPCVIGDRLSKPALSLLRQYISQVYPLVANSSTGDIEPLCRAIWMCRMILKQILMTSANEHQPALRRFITECSITFSHCYQAFYPTDSLKWQGLCELLLHEQRSAEVSPQSKSCSAPEREFTRLLAVIFGALGKSPSSSLATFLPHQLSKIVYNERPTPALAPPQSPPGSPMSGNFHMPTRSESSEGPALHGRLLNEALSVRDPDDMRLSGTLTFKDVVDKLIQIVVNPLAILVGHGERSVCPPQLVDNACKLLVAIISELSTRVAIEKPHADAPGHSNLSSMTPLVTPTRFKRVQMGRTWNTGNGSPDAICFTVDRSGISIAGATIYGASKASSDWVYELDLLDFSAAGPSADLAVERWAAIETVSGNFAPDDCTDELFEIRFERPVPIRKNTRYALRLRNHGAKTNSGDCGVPHVKGPDGTTFFFIDCTLSFNGTNQTRGQISQILYHNTPVALNANLASGASHASEVTVPDVVREAVDTTLTISTSLVEISHEFMARAVESLEDNQKLVELESTKLVSSLLPAVFSQLVKIASTDTSTAVRVLSLVKTLLGNVVTISKKLGPKSPEKSRDERFYAIVESDHPYKAANVSRYKIQFPDEVDWITVEFDPKSCTAQPEDYLQIYCATLKNMEEEKTEEVDVNQYWAVLRRFSGCEGWPTNAVVLPGNALLFSLESASEYARDEKSTNYGFRCQVVGHCGTSENSNGFAHLEKELAHLGGECCSALLKQDPVFLKNGMEFDPAVIETFKTYPEILGRGPPLERCPNIDEALSGNIPTQADCSEKKFLKDFISAEPGTAGSKLVMWLQPESFVDPQKCELVFNKEELQSGSSSAINVVVKDQYGKTCSVSNVKVEIFAVLLGCGPSTVQMNQTRRGDLTFGGLPAPCTETPYEASVKEKMIYHSITMMKAYEKYSFEELRFMSPKKQATESLMVSQAGELYTANWTPSSVGRFELKALIDGYPVTGEDSIIEVRELPHGKTFAQPPPQTKSKGSSAMSKVRKFVGIDSQGLRIRKSPSLQSDQIGVVPANGHITFIDAVQNDDGIWVRLTPESAHQYCRRLTLSQAHEAWCLQYHKHFSRTLLVAAEDKIGEDGKNVNGLTADAKEIYVRKGPGTYLVVNSGTSGHNIRSRASLRSGPPIGMLVMGNYVTVNEDLVNNDGLWLKLSKDSMQHYCTTTDGDAWTLAQSSIAAGSLVFLQHESEVLSDEAASETEETNTTTTRAEKNSERSKGFDLSGTSQGFLTSGSGNSEHDACSSGSVSPFVFGSLSSTPSTSLHTLNTVSEAAGYEESPKAPQTTPQQPMPPQSSDEHSKTVLQRWLKNNEDHIAETRARDNFNPVPAELQGVSVKELVKAIGESRANGNGATPPATPPKTSPTPRRRASSPRAAAKVFSDQPITASGHRTPQPVSPQLAKCLQEELSIAPPMRSSSSPSKSAASPAPSSSGSSTSTVRSVKRIAPIEALAPSVAQSIRAVFAAVLWFEGLTAEAMKTTADLSLNKDNAPLLESSAADKGPKSQFVALWNNILSLCMSSFNTKNGPPSLKDEPDVTQKDRKRGASVSKRPTAPNMFGNSAVEACSTPGSMVGFCDMCDVAGHQAITQHMRTAHQGCGGPSKGKGYNSIGNYCGGWAGNCGDGGTVTSCWYLLCEECRSKHKENDAKRKQCQNAILSGKIVSGSTVLSPIDLQEKHKVAMQNSLFVLSLSSLSNCDKLLSLESNPFGMDRADVQFASLDSLGACAQKTKATQDGDQQLIEQFAHDYLSQGAVAELLSTERARHSMPPVMVNNPSGASTPLGVQKTFHRSVSISVADWRPSRPSPESAPSGTSEDDRLAAVVKNSTGSPVVNFIMSFCSDINALTATMIEAIRRLACRVYALQAMRWLLHSVSQPTCLHDILWCFVSSLSSGTTNPDKDDENVCLCNHPLEDLAFACDQHMAFPLQATFHQFLESISNLMAHLQTPSALQQMAVRCWCLRFTAQDHLFLHSSQVFSNISKILSHSEEASVYSQRDHDDMHGVNIFHLQDVSSQCEISTSSRPAMVNSLLDNSTETFWESSDEDRNKTKFIQIKGAQGVNIHYVAVHIDNSRDIQNRVNHIAFKTGDETSLNKIKSEDVSLRHVGWIGVDVEGGKVVRIELKGPDNSLRVRQVKVLDHPVPIVNGMMTADAIQHSNCEAETLKVFRLLTSQVFGKLISGDAATSSGDGSNDLKEHMVGILFSRNNLTHLQKQVCSHIVATIKKETQRVREEWEVSLSSSSPQLAPQSDAYCFEMLSMVLALSGSSVGRAYLAQQAGLLRDLFSLLHTGSARVQRQVTSLLRRVLPEVSPQVLASILQVPLLPSEDFTSIHGNSDDGRQDLFDTQRPGILDVLLACIAKAVTVQIKTKISAVNDQSKKNASTAVSLATTIHPKDDVGTRWWLRGCSTRKHAQMIIQLIRDMCAGLLTEQWARVAKSAIAENILNLTRLDRRFRSRPQDCIKTPTLWLCLASLCVVDKEHVDRLSSGQWNRKDSQQEKPLCENHDDGETTAMIFCNSCGNLCCECDRFLHLNHKKTKSHSRQVFKEEEDAIKVDLHEGCGRTKLFWLIALADSNTLKAMVEFREQNTNSKASVNMCRFCKATTSGLSAVCGGADCVEHAKNACTKLHPCGHYCGGVLNDKACLPCLYGCQGKDLRQDADDMCMICFSEALCCAPVISLSCGHMFHHQCTVDALSRKWPGPRITFNFALCPICKAPIDHPLLKEQLQPVWELQEDVKRKALMRLEYEGLHSKLSQEERASYAMERYAYYVCFKCNKAYFGGEVRCELEADVHDDGYDAAELVCGACSDVSSAQMCPKHGADFLEYKCRYCCSVAVFFCFGTTHFCNPCHDDFQRVLKVLKSQLPTCPAGPKLKQLEGDECPLHVKHPPTGEEYALGCGVCRNAHTF
ncbi:E3 ubiquitin-protein ligase MYCBP2 [Galendromus occidentalis]|uniref:RCR-type E3 ubiquitin transferase n=1 Tax=Galendromus occidentalis TaxID=34638 RepID=A0AAJ7SCW7_9ACAR|nr:E3 ubiquitin-protein ligase MYCBP2 [Galendromus occidentalis]